MTIAGILYAILLIDAATVAWRVSRGRNGRIDKSRFNAIALVKGVTRIHLPMVITAGLGWILWRTDPTILSALESAGMAMLHVLVPYGVLTALAPVLGAVLPRDLGCAIRNAITGCPWLRAVVVIGGCLYGMSVAPRYDVVIVIGFLMAALLNYEDEMTSAVTLESMAG